MNTGVAARARTIIPCLGLALGLTLTYLGLIILIALSVLLVKEAVAGAATILADFSSMRCLAAFRLSVGMAFVAALCNAIFGFLLAWVLVRYQFAGRMLIDAMI